MDGFELRRATKRDLADVLEILDEAAAWLASLGVEQWPSPFPRAVVERDFECHTVWLATVAGEAIATASVLMNDPMFWGGTGGNAWYLHRFAIRRKAEGTGSAVLQALEAQAASNGVEYLRLDCARGLQRYYEEAGYLMRSWMTLVRATSSPPRSEWFCYEKKSTTPASNRLAGK